ncbi:aspartic proteinase-like protein 2 [Dendrobium catenatum]|nr:aspartic proteinase-like protein 2 [Dendrobium catenatum]
MVLSVLNGLLAGLAIAVLVFIPSAAWNDGSQLTMQLERGMPARAPVEVLRARDRFRHRRILQGAARSSYGVVDFPVEGSWNPFTVGLYFTRVKLGNPAKEFYVQIDTGSDILWVTCNPCNGCPTSSGLNIKLESFEPDKSSTSSSISCSDQRCTSAIQTGEATCSSSDSSSSPCSYSFQYGDGSGTSGYYVSDTLYFDTVTENEQTLNSSATIIFGCSNSQSGDLTKSDRAIDGIFGFGQHELSVISQLSSAGVAPKVFSHCLKGSDSGGGILVLGEIVEPGIVYTPLVQSKPHYNLNLESIAVNGQTLSVDSSVFTTSNTQKRRRDHTITSSNPLLPFDFARIQPQSSTPMCYVPSNPIQLATSLHPDASACDDPPPSATVRLRYFGCRDCTHRFFNSLWLCNFGSLVTIQLRSFAGEGKAARVASSAPSLLSDSLASREEYRLHDLHLRLLAVRLRCFAKGAEIAPSLLWLLSPSLCHILYIM